MDLNLLIDSKIARGVVTMDEPDVISQLESSIELASVRQISGLIDQVIESIDSAVLLRVILQYI